MKVLHLLYAHTIAGAEKYLYYLLPHMAEEGIECHIYIVTPPESEQVFAAYRDKFTAAGISSEFKVGTLSGFIKIARSVSAYMKANDINYLHSHLSNSELIAVLVKKLFNKKIRLISTKHGYREDILMQVPLVKDMKELKRIASRSPYYYITKWLVNNMDHNYAVSKAMAKLYVDLGLSKTPMPFIHHGLEVNTASTAENAGEYRLSEKQIVIVGRLEELKGHAYLMEAMVEVKKEFPEVKLLVIGDGVQKEALQAQVASLGIAGQVVFMGFRDDPYSYIRHSDVITLPSMFESFGLVYIEAFALGTPVIAFDTAAANELIENEITGILVPPKDSAAIAQKIIYLLKNPGSAKEIAARAQEKYKVYFSTERMVKQTAGYYRTIYQSDMLR